MGDKPECADGVETRSSHAPGVGKTSGTADGGVPAVSAFDDTHALPGVSGGRYDAARMNFAHRTASWIAENDYSVLRAEAGYLRRFALNQLEAAIGQAEGLKTEAGRVAGFGTAMMIQ